MKIYELIRESTILSSIVGGIVCFLFIGLVGWLLKKLNLKVKIYKLIRENTILSFIVGGIVCTFLLSLINRLLNLNLRLFDYILLFLFLTILILYILIYKNTKSLQTSDGHKNLKDDFNRHKRDSNNKFKEIDNTIIEIRKDLHQISNKPKKYEEIELDEKAVYILSRVGAEYNGVASRRDLFNSSIKKFRPKNVQGANLSFNILINTLLSKDLIRVIDKPSNNFLDLGIDNGEINDFIEITDKGLEYLRVVNIKNKKE